MTALIPESLRSYFASLEDILHAPSPGDKGLPAPRTTGS
jgi:hypothetical protein